MKITIFTKIMSVIICLFTQILCYLQNRQKREINKSYLNEYKTKTKNRIIILVLLITILLIINRFYDMLYITISLYILIFRLTYDSIIFLIIKFDLLDSKAKKIYPNKPKMQYCLKTCEPATISATICTIISVIIQVNSNVFLEKIIPTLKTCFMVMFIISIIINYLRLFIEEKEINLNEQKTCEKIKTYFIFSIKLLKELKKGLSIKEKIIVLILIIGIIYFLFIK